MTEEIPQDWLRRIYAAQQTYEDSDSLGDLERLISVLEEAAAATGSVVISQWLGQMRRWRRMLLLLEGPLETLPEVDDLVGSLSPCPPFVPFAELVAAQQSWLQSGGPVDAPAPRHYRHRFDHRTVSPWWRQVAVQQIQDLREELRRGHADPARTSNVLYMISVLSLRISFENFGDAVCSLVRQSAILIEAARLNGNVDPILNSVVADSLADVAHFTGSLPIQAASLFVAEQASRGDPKGLRIRDSLAYAEYGMYEATGASEYLDRFCRHYREIAQEALAEPGVALPSLSYGALDCLTTERWPDCRELANCAVQLATALVPTHGAWAAEDLLSFQGLPSRGALAAIRLGDPVSAVELLEGGQCLLAHDRLSHWYDAFREATWQFPELWDAFDLACRQWQEALSSPGAQPAEERLSVFGALAAAREALEEAVGFPLLPRTSFADVVATAVEAAAPVVYLLCTEVGGAALVVEPDASVRAVELGDLTTEAVESWCGLISSLESDRGVAVRGSVRPDAPAITEAEAEDIVNQLRNDLTEALAPLGDALSGPIRLIPTGTLARLPVPALLASRWGHAASVGVTARHHRMAMEHSRRSRPKGFAVLAAPDPCHLTPGQEVPPLPGAVREAAMLEKNHEATARTGPDATRACLAELTTRAWAVLHLATHGLADPAHPERSAALLADGPEGTAEAFTVAEIRQSSLEVGLVSLAACWLGAPGVRLPDEAIGFPTLLIEAGAAAVLAPLWPVPDEATASFMESFYAYLAAGEDPAGALARSQADMGDFEPTAWAAFFLTGA